MRARPPRTAFAIAALGAALALPAGAHGATASTDRACYLADDTSAVTVTGAGFTPGAQVNVLLDGKVGSLPLTAGPDGSVTTRLAVPEPPRGGSKAHERGHALRLQQTDGGPSASAAFTAARFVADYTPGNASTLGKVRFMAFGLAPDLAPGARRPTVYVHYVDPRGKVKRTVALGRAQGPCGSIRRTKRLRVFPFTPRSGKWLLQFDTSKKYVKNAPGAFPLRLTL